MRRHAVLGGHVEHGDDFLVGGAGRVVDPEADANGAGLDGLRRDLAHPCELGVAGGRVEIGYARGLPDIGVPHRGAVVDERAVGLERHVPALDVDGPAVHADHRGDPVLDLVALRLTVGPDPGQDVHEARRDHQARRIDHPTRRHRLVRDGNDAFAADEHVLHPVGPAGRIHDPAADDGDVAGSLGNQGADRADRDQPGHGKELSKTRPQHGSRSCLAGGSAQSMEEASGATLKPPGTWVQISVVGGYRGM